MTNDYDATVSVIATATNTVTATVAVGSNPHGVAVTPDGTRVYVANLLSNTVSVMDTATNTVTATIGVGAAPVAFGQFIGPGTGSGGSCREQFIAAVQTCLQSPGILRCIKEALPALRECLSE